MVHEEGIEKSKYRQLENRNHRQVRKTIVEVRAKSKQAFPIPTRPSSV